MHLPPVLESPRRGAPQFRDKRKISKAARANVSDFARSSRGDNVGISVTYRVNDTESGFMHVVAVVADHVSMNSIFGGYLVYEQERVSPR